jgi:hypothetical protein
VDSIVLAEEYHKLVVAPLMDICDKKEHFDEKTTMDTVSLCATLNKVDQLFIKLLVNEGEGKEEKDKNIGRVKKCANAKNNTGHEGGTPIDMLLRIVQVIFKHSLKLMDHYERLLVYMHTSRKSRNTKDNIASKIEEKLQQLDGNEVELEKTFMSAFIYLKDNVLKHGNFDVYDQNWNSHVYISTYH